MIWLMSCFIFFCSVLFSENEVEAFLRETKSSSTAEAEAFIKKNGHREDVEKKCTMQSDIWEKSNPDHSAKLFLFASFSMPLESWKEYSHFLEKIDGTFILRGVPSNSFADLSQKILKLRKEGVFAKITIDPESFDKYHVDAVPSFILEEGNHFDKITGHIQLAAALKIFSEKGQTSASATRLLKTTGAM